MSEAIDVWFLSTKEALKAMLMPFRDLAAIFSNPWIGFGIIGSMFLFVLGISLLKDKKNFQKTMRNPRTLVISALMIGLNLVLSYYTIRLSPSLRIGFGFVTQPMVAICFGPLVCCITGMIQDILSYLLNPVGAYVPAYTLSVGIAGMAYGLVLYQKPISFWRILLAKTLVLIVCNILFNSIALAPTVGSGFVGILPARIIKNLLSLPVQTVLVYLILNMFKKSGQLKHT